MITTTERNSILNAMTRLLEEYDYEYSYDALHSIIDEWESQKGELIKAFKKHPNYIEGKFMIVYDYNFERVLDENGVRNFRDWLTCYGGPITTFHNQLPERIAELKDKQFCCYLPSDLYRFFDDYYNYAQRTISDEIANKLNEVVPEIHAHAGQKTSRVINKLCVFLGYDKHPEYNREFAKFADSLSPMTIKRHTVLSLNPLDYLTMSFGNSWASCHTIDKENKRNMPNSYEGQYSSGTMSYMLDPSSMVFYTIDTAYDGDEYYFQPKIHRQMFHWGEQKLVQGRLYPQDNDYNSQEYEGYRKIVQEIMSTIFDFPNLWTFIKGTSAASRYITSRGTHYQDYCSYGNCTLSKIQGIENENNFQVGARPICIECGNRHSCSENINCCYEGDATYCEDCGCRIYDEEDIYYVNGYAYCRDCVSYCEVCDEYHRDDEHYIRSEDRYVCDSCLDRYYTYCEECEEYVDRDYVQYVESTDCHVCDECLTTYYSVCDKCGEYFRNDDVFEYDGCSYCEDCYEQITEESEAC